MRNQIPIVVHTTDKYREFWDGWYTFYKKHIQHDGVVYFLTDKIKPKFVNDPNIIHIQTGIGEWGERLLKGLNQIDAEYIYYMQEDYWAKEDIWLNDDYKTLFDKYDMDCLHICLKGDYGYFETVEYGLLKYEQGSPFAWNHTFGLWNKEKFMSNIKWTEGPWDNEIKGSHRINKNKHKMYVLVNDWYANTVRKGKITTEGIEMLKNGTNT